MKKKMTPFPWRWPSNEDGAPPRKRWRGDRRRDCMTPRGRETRRGTWWDGDKEILEGIDFAQDSEGDHGLLFIPDSDSEGGITDDFFNGSEFVPDSELQDSVEPDAVEALVVDKGVDCPLAVCGEPGVGKEVYGAKNDKDVDGGKEVQRGKEVDGGKAGNEVDGGKDGKEVDDLVFPSEWAIRNGVDDVVMDMLAIYHPLYMLKRKRD